MNLHNRPTTSREYKLILNTDRFMHRNEGSDYFYNLLELLVKKSGGTLKKQLEEKQRTTSYLDTLDFALRNRGYVLRLRKDLDGDTKITLKYRESDRYLSAVQDLFSNDQKSETKFEEDIIPPFTSKYSQSTSIKRKSDAPLTLENISQVIDLFPGLKHLHLPMEAIYPVNQFIAHEIARDFCTIQFEDDETEVKAALSHWYLRGLDNEIPLISEFSFGYEAIRAKGENNQDKGDKKKQEKQESNALEQYSPQVVLGCNRLFRSLQNQPGWLNLNSTTKTAYAYDAF